MSPEEYQRAAELFNHARVLGEGERDIYLDRHCPPSLRPDVDAMLQHHAAPISMLRSDVLRRRQEIDSRPAPDWMPQVIGRYRIVRLIARGGMGAVFEAQQQSPPRRVAIKAVRSAALLGADRWRFDYEAAALARLDHPFIAKIFEVGSHDDGGGSFPFFAMEYVEGEPITRFVQASRLSVRQRAALMAGVCDAVQHAHEKGVVHRDLKPANILVTKAGLPKLLDFGVCRLLDVAQAAGIRTGTGEILGTIGYMSPEQVDGQDIDTRSDVYALGIVLHELLSGRHPWAAPNHSLLDALHAAHEHRLEPLRRLSSDIQGDLKTIVAHAMAAERQRRYASAGQLADDLRRYLAHQPLNARPPTICYVVRKFLRRHPWKVTTSSIVALLVMLVIGGGLWHASRMAEARRGNLAMLAMMESGLNDSKWLDVLPRTTIDPGDLDRLRTNIAAQYSDSPADACSAYAIMATLLQQKGRLSDAMAFHRAAAEAAGAAFGPTSKSARRARGILAGAYSASMAFDQAKSMYQNDLQLARDDHAPAEEITSYLYGLVRVDQEKGRPRDAAPMCYELLRPPLEEAAGPVQRGVARRVLAMVAASDNRVDEAQVLLQAAWHDLTAQSALSAATELQMQILCDLGQLRLRIGDDQKAMDHFREAQALLVARGCEKMPFAADVKLAMGGVHWLRKDFEAAESAFREALDIAEHSGDSHELLLASSLDSLGVCLRDRGRLDEAIQVLARSLAIKRHWSQASSVWITNTKANLAKAYCRVGRGDEALALALEVCHEREADGNSVAVVEATALLSLAQIAADQRVAAWNTAQAALEQRKRDDLKRDWRADVAIEAGVQALIGLGDPTKARALLAEDLDDLKAAAGDDSAATRRALDRLEAFDRSLGLQ